MIHATMAVAAVTPMRRGRAEQARDARFPRLVALILDTIFVGIITSVATAVYGVTQVTWGSPTLINGVAWWGSNTAIPAFGAGAIWLGYYAICEALFSATPGKVLNGLRVVSVDDRRLRLWSVLARNALRLVDVLPSAYLLGGFSTLVTQNSQRLGDLVGGTTVVLKRDAVEPGTTRIADRTARTGFVVGVVAILLFTAAFDYFERPVLVIQGEYNQQQLGPDVVSFSLGQPIRSLGTVIYPITARTPNGTCSGNVTLTWQGLFGWQMNGFQLECPPAS
jgi:uncharacterized RDD family membrane protein YckC